jgi:hypothetical protein
MLRQGSSEPSLRLDGEGLTIEVFVLAALSGDSAGLGRRRVVLNVDVAGLTGRYDTLATADVVARLRSSMSDWEAGGAAHLELPAGRTLRLMRSDGAVSGVLTLGERPSGVAVSVRFLVNE